MSATHLYEAALRSAANVRLALEEEDLTDTGRAMLEEALELLEHARQVDDIMRINALREGLERRLRA